MKRAGIETSFSIHSLLPCSRVHVADEAGIVFSQRQALYRIDDYDTMTPHLLGSISSRGKYLASRWRMADRALRYSIQNVVEIPGRGWLVSNADGWWILDPSGKCISGPPFPAGRPMARGVCHHRGCVYAGDYHANPERNPVRIYRSDDLRGVSIAWQFPTGTVRHVHGLIPDLHIPERIWVLTGDLDHECSIYATDDEFASLTKMLSRGQHTRATDLVCLKDMLLWGMDAPNEQPFVVSWKRSAAMPCVEHGLSGPAYYMTQNQAGTVYVATTVEPGLASDQRHARIYGRRPDGTWLEKLRLTKDRWPQYGMIFFPSGVLRDNYVVFSTRALVPYEGYMIIARDQENS